MDKIFLFFTFRCRGAFLLLIFSFGITAGCNTTEPPPPKNPAAAGLTLSLTDVSCTEAWVNLKTQNVSFPAQINFLLDSKALMNISLTSADTTIYIDSLQPSKTYQLKAEYNNNNGTAVSPAAAGLTVQTLDTTSNNFTFTTYTFGDAGAGSSSLSDVAIINENDIWAVGAIYMNDSTGKPDPLPYNAVRWDGSKWELKRITTEFRGNLITVPLEGIFAFSSTDIWMVGSLPIHGDGNTWTMYDVRTTTDPNLSLSKGWGSNSNDMYFVGRGGSIAHYSNGQWSKIESGTSLQFLDIYGANDSQTGQQQILAIASNGFARELLEIQGNSVKVLPDSGLANDLEGIWFVPNRKYYVVGAGIHYKHLLNDNLWSHYPPGVVTSYLSGGVRGSNINNVFVTGSFFEIAHFNGVSWHNYRDVIPYNSNGALGRLDVKGELFITVGRSGSAGVIIMGKQN